MVNAQRSMASVIFVLALNVLAADIPPNPLAPLAGMETGAWILEPWGDPGAAERASVGERKILKLIYSGGEKKKTAFKHLTCFGLAKNGTLTVHAYALGKPPALALALSSSAAYQWHESAAVPLKEGWNTIEVSAAAGWKTEANGWKYTSAVSNLDEIRAVDLIVYGDGQSGVVYIEGLHYQPDERGREIAGHVKDMLSEDAVLREKSEKALVAIGRSATEALQQLFSSDRPEVLLRAASALRQIGETKEAPPADPKLREQLEKQKEEQRFEEARRNADYYLNGLLSEKVKLLGLIKDAQTELTMGRAHLDQIKHVDAEKRKTYEVLLDRIEAQLKDLEGLWRQKKE